VTLKSLISWNTYIFKYYYIFAEYLKIHENVGQLVTNMDRNHWTIRIEVKSCEDFVGVYWVHLYISSLFYPSLSQSQFENNNGCDPFIFFSLLANLMNKYRIRYGNKQRFGKKLGPKGMGLSEYTLCTLTWVVLFICPD